MKFPVKFLIGVLAIVIGISGALVCICTQSSSEIGVVEDYVCAINDGDIETLEEYFPTFMMGFDVREEEESDETDPIKAAIDKCGFRVPSAAKTIESVELIGCTIKEQKNMLESMYGLSGSLVEALIKVEYLDDEDETCSKIYQEELVVLQYEGDDYVVSN